jgi:transposase InsO family protein
VARLIAAQRVEYGIPQAAVCPALGVCEAWFYKWRDGDASPRRARREQLVIAIRQMFAAHHGTYGSPRITDDLREAGWRVSEKTVAAIMREQHLVARAKRRGRSTTRPGKGRWRAPDLVGRDFPATTVNQKWYGDGTELVTDEGKLYLASVWTWVRGASSGSRSSNTTTPSWPTRRWRWPSRCAAARRPSLE